MFIVFRQGWAMFLVLHCCSKFWTSVLTVYVIFWIFKQNLAITEWPSHTLLQSSTLPLWVSHATTQTQRSAEKFSSSARVTTAQLLYFKGTTYLLLCLYLRLFLMEDEAHVGRQFLYLVGMVMSLKNLIKTIFRCCYLPVAASHWLLHGRGHFSVFSSKGNLSNTR